MKPKMKSVLVAFSIVVATLFVAYIALFVFLPVIVGGSFSTMGAFFNDLFRYYGDAFLFKGGPKYLPSYALYGLLVVFLVLMTINIVFSIKKGKGLFSLYSIPLFIISLVFSYVLMDTFSFKTSSLVAIFQTKKVGYIIYFLSLYIVGYLLYIFSIVLLFLGLAGLKNKSKIELDQAENTPELSLDASKDINGAEASQAVNDTTLASPEPIPLFVPEPEPQPEEDVKTSKVEETNKEEPLTKESLMGLLKEVIKDMVHDEVSRINEFERNRRAETSNSSVIGATFGAPLIVQNFYGINPNQQEIDTPKEEKPSEEPKIVEKIVEKQVPVEVVKFIETDKKVETKPEEKPVEPAPISVPVEKEVVEEKKEEPAEPVEKPKIIRIPFEDRIINADQEMKDNYNALKNDILSYGVKSRVSNSGDTFRLHRVTFVKITIAGKSLKLYFALNPEDYKESTVPVQDAGEKNIYSEIPLVFKVKSPLSLKRAKQLIQDVMEKHELEQGEVGNTDWVKDIENNVKK